MFFQCLSAENSTFFHPAVEFIIYNSSLQRDSETTINNIFTNYVQVLEKQVDDDRRDNYDRNVDRKAFADHHLQCIKLFKQKKD